MTKNIMSIAAAAALLTSGASAFETNTTAALLNINKVQGDYNTSTQLTATLLAPDGVTFYDFTFAAFPTEIPLGQAIDVDLDGLGDALVFPAFNQKDGWGTEIVVRNNHPYAMVAKFVAYSGIDSQELRDFNIYLSANDVFRCTIKDGLITTSDDSVHTGAGWGVLDNITIPEDTGYIAVYGMISVTDINIHTPEAAAAGKQDPKETVRQTYYSMLDILRPKWDTHAMEAGVFVEDLLNPVPMRSPKIMETQAIGLPIFLCDGLRWDQNETTCAVADRDGPYTIMNMDDMSLSGTVRIYNTDRDLMMPATAVNNYGNNDFRAGPVFGMLWAPKELAAFADRNLINPDSSATGAGAGYDIYSESGVVQDSADNIIERVWYTFNNAAVDASASTDLQNKLIVTQPEKRTMIQLGRTDYWQKNCTPAGINEGTAEAWLIDPLANGSRYGLVYGADVWDEAEDKDTIAQDPEVSPGGSKAKQKICNEVGEIANLEEGTEMAEKNGYAVVDFFQGAPAIISQMTASETGGTNREINWVNVPVQMQTPQPN